MCCPCSRTRSASRSPSFSTLEEYAPARPRSLLMISTAALVGFSGSVVSGCPTSEYVARAGTARVSSRAYGAARWARCCALMMRDAAMSSMARVIFLVDSTDLIRARYSRSDTAMCGSAPLLLDDRLLLELLVGQGLGRRVVADLDVLARRGLELVEEAVVRRLRLAGGVVLELLR